MLLVFTSKQSKIFFHVAASNWSKDCKQNKHTMNSKKLNLPQKYLGRKKLKKKIKLEQDK